MTGPTDQPFNRHPSSSHPYEPYEPYDAYEPFDPYDPSNLTDLDDKDLDKDLDQYLDELARLQDQRMEDDFEAFDDYDDCEHLTWGTDPLVVDADPEADERLHEIMTRIDAVVPKNAETFWVRILEDPTTPDQPATVEFDRDLPALIGYVAPPSCLALAIVGKGRAHRYEPPEPATPRPSREQDREQDREQPDPGENPIDVPPEGMAVTATCLMDRTGRMAGHTRFADGNEIPSPPETGRLVDALRRAFALPTVRPQQSAGELVSRFWLANVLAVAEDSPTPLNWKRVRELHPSAAVLKDIGVSLTGPTLDRAREISGSAWTWSRLRYQAIEGDWLPEIIDSKLAAWMDDGMFSRWVLEGTLPTQELLRLAEQHVSPTVRRRLARAVGARADGA